MISGWLNIYKRKNISSAYVVYLCKKSLRIQNLKIGHGGTLDKEAEGILPVAVGKTTKLIKFLLTESKSYIFKVQFGLRTETGDSSGKIVENINNIPSIKQVKSHCKNFIGKIIQTPPKYSAIKINGVRSYKLARENKEFQISDRSVHIYNFCCINFNQAKGSASFFTKCSSGTYIRTLAEDLAKSVSSICVVTELQRVSVGNFQLSESYDSNKLISSKKRFPFNKNIVYCLLSPEHILKCVKFFVADKHQVSLISRGNSCYFCNANKDFDLVFIKFQNNVISFGYLYDKLFTPTRVLI